ncbi:MAG: ComE operon protein 1 [Burkholderia gladioli]|nr:MAG: ComE operon protein 1 [Burkholderia gladioli]
MLKKLLMLFVALSLSLSAAMAPAVEVNTADQAALESVKGLGPVKSKAIIDERAKNGPFKSADDLASRVKGLGQKSVANLEAAGLTIGGSSAPPTGAKATPARATKTQAGTSTGAPAPAPTAATPAPSPAPVATTTPVDGGKPAKATRASNKKDKAAAAASAAAATGASAPAGASEPKAKKSRKAKKSQGASTASGA